MIFMPIGAHGRLHKNLGRTPWLLPWGPLPLVLYPTHDSTDKSMSGMLYFAPWSLCQLGTRRASQKIRRIDLGSHLGVLRPRALILHMTLWTKLKITERTPKLFSFSFAPPLRIFCRKNGHARHQGCSKGICVRGARKGVVTAAALPCNSYLISLPSLPSPPFLSVNLSPRFSPALPALRDL